MTKISSIGLVLAGALLFGATSAHAATHTINGSVAVVLGTRTSGTSSQKGTWIDIFNQQTGACSKIKIGDLNGLFDNTTVQGDGTAASLSLAVVSTANFVSACGITYQPLLSNGFTVTLIGNTATDWVDGGTAGGWVTARGGSGGDFVFASFPGEAFGDNGDDFVYSYGTAWDRLFGGNNNDVLCSSQGATILELHGGSGTNDRACGWAWGVAPSGIESFTCAPCGSW